MARAPTTLDPFNAIAEPRRRRLLEALGGEEMQVNDIVLRLGWPQPTISKHLGVLKEVGLVRVRRDGRRRLYRLDAEGLRTVHDWTKHFEKFWSHQVDRIKQRAEQRARDRGTAGPAKQRDDDTHRKER